MLRAHVYHWFNQTLYMYRYIMVISLATFSSLTSVSMIQRPTHQSPSVAELECGATISARIRVPKIMAILAQAHQQQRQRRNGLPQLERLPPLPSSKWWVRRAPQAKLRIQVLNRSESTWAAVSCKRQTVLAKHILKIRSAMRPITSTRKLLD